MILLIIITFLCCKPYKNPIHYDTEKSDFYHKKASEIKQGAEYQQILLDSALYYNPDNAKVWFEKSAWEIKKGDYEKYFDYMNKAVELDTDGYIGWRGAIKMYFLHDFDGAIQDFNIYRSMYNDSIELAARGETLDFLLGQAYWQKKEYQKAINYFNKNIRSNSEEWVDVYTFIYLGICYEAVGQKGNAINSYKKALQYYPESGDANYYLSKIFFESQNIKLASYYIDKAIKNAEKGYLNKDSYKDVFGQLYISDLYELKNKILKSK